MTDLDTEGIMFDLMSLRALLSKHKVTAWVTHLDEVMHTATDGPEAFKAAVLQMYKGTMGSLPDLFISRVNGHDVDDERAANAELDRLVDELRVKANRLSRVWRL